MRETLFQHSYANIVYYETSQLLLEEKWYLGGNLHLNLSFLNKVKSHLSSFSLNCLFLFLACSAGTVGGLFFLIFRNLFIT